MIQETRHWNCYTCQRTYNLIRPFQGSVSFSRASLIISYVAYSSLSIQARGFQARRRYRSSIPFHGSTLLRQMARESTTVTGKEHLFGLIALCPGYFQRGLVQMLAGKTTAITDLLFPSIVSSRARELAHYFPPDDSTYVTKRHARHVKIETCRHRRNNSQLHFSA